MSKVNLLPIDLSPESSKAKLSHILRNITIVGFILLVALLLVVTAIFSLNYLEMRQLAQKQEKLKESIKALEKTEQRLVLTKDRLVKIKKIFNQKMMTDSTKNILYWQEDLSTSLRRQSVEILPGRIIFSFQTTSSTELVRILSSVIERDDYSKISLTSLHFSPEGGYSAELVLYKDK